nr:Chain A, METALLOTHIONEIN [Strongylocentrotus purpuratus]
PDVKCVCCTEGKECACFGQDCCVTGECCKDGTCCGI